MWSEECGVLECQYERVSVRGCGRITEAGKPPKRRNLDPRHGTTGGTVTLRIFRVLRLPAVHNCDVLSRMRRRGMYGERRRRHRLLSAR
jgi:hypothetical protein